MPIELPTYLSLADGDALVAQLPGLVRYKAADNATRLQMLTAATQRIDAAHPFQGGRYEADQSLAFPRRDDGWITTARGWRDCRTTLAAGVPDGVLLAVLHEADAMLDRERETLQARIRDGLASVSTGDLSESYKGSPGDVSAAAVPLCREAAGLLAQYRLRTGRLL